MKFSLVLSLVVAGLLSGSLAHAEFEAEALEAAAIEQEKASAPCPDFDMDGIWHNGHGAIFRIKQYDCNKVSFYDKGSGITFAFNFDGRLMAPPKEWVDKVSNGSSPDARKIISGMRVKAQYVNPGTAGRWQSAVQVVLTGTLPLPDFMDDKLAHLARYEYKAHIRPVGWDSTSMSQVGNNTPAYAWGRVKHIRLEPELVRLSSVDSTNIIGGAKEVFLQGANAVLGFTKHFLSAELIRIEPRKARVSAKAKSASAPVAARK